MVVPLAPLELAYPGSLLVPPLELAGAVAAAIVLIAPLEIGAAVVAFVCTVLVRACVAVMAGVRAVAGQVCHGQPNFGTHRVTL